MIKLYNIQIIAKIYYILKIYKIIPCVSMSKFLMHKHLSTTSHSAFSQKIPKTISGKIRINERSFLSINIYL